MADSKALTPLLLVVFIGTLGFSIVLPFLVFLVLRLGGNALIYGLLGATYSAFQLVGAPVLGRWSDRVGRRRVLLVSQLGTLVAWLLFLVALLVPVTGLVSVESGLLGVFTLTLPLLILFAARALDGLTGGNVSVANAYVADVTEESERSSAFGKLAVAQSLGFVAGPALAGLLGGLGIGEVGPVLAAVGISVLASALIWWRLPESRPTVLEERPPAAMRKLMGQEQRDCFKTGSEKAVKPASFLSALVVSMLAVQFMVFVAFNFFYVSFPVHAATALEWDLGTVGVYFAVLSGSMALVQGPILSRLSKRFGDLTLLAAGGVVLVVAFLLYAWVSGLAVFATAVLLAAGNGLMWPSVLSLTSRAAGPEAQGAVQGFAGSAGAVASIVGLVAGGLLYASISGQVFLISAAFAVAAVITGVSAGARCPQANQRVLKSA